jgi:DNA-binding MarR family transcriptional regulator
LRQLAVLTIAVATDIISHGQDDPSGDQTEAALPVAASAGGGEPAPYIKKVEGISLSQFNVLRILRGARPEKLKVSEISDRMITRDPDITRLVDRLVKQGLAERERDTADRRVVFVTISKAGLDLLGRLDDAVTVQSSAVLAGLNTTQLRELDTLLDQLREGMKPFP